MYVATTDSTFAELTLAGAVEGTYLGLIVGGRHFVYYFVEAQKLLFVSIYVKIKSLNWCYLLLKQKN